MNEGVRGHLILEIRLHGIESLFNALPSSPAQEMIHKPPQQPSLHVTDLDKHGGSQIPLPGLHSSGSQAGGYSYRKSRSCSCALLGNTLSRVLSTQDSLQRAIQSLEGSIASFCPGQGSPASAAVVTEKSDFTKTGFGVLRTPPFPSI